MNILCQNCRKMLLSFERRVAKNQLCGHFVCDQCYKAFVKFPSKDGHRCACGSDFTILNQVDADEFVKIALHDLRQIGLIVTDIHLYQKIDERAVPRRQITVSENNDLVSELLFWQKRRIADVQILLETSSEGCLHCCACSPTWLRHLSEETEDSQTRLFAACWSGQIANRRLNSLLVWWDAWRNRYVYCAKWLLDTGQTQKVFPDCKSRRRVSTSDQLEQRR